jgi:hypothetical protein
MHIAFKKAGAVNQLIRLLSSNDDAIQLTATQALEALSASKHDFTTKQQQQPAKPVETNHGQLEELSSLLQKMEEHKENGL